MKHNECKKKRSCSPPLTLRAAPANTKPKLRHTGHGCLEGWAECGNRGGGRPTPSRRPQHRPPPRGGLPASPGLAPGTRGDGWANDAPHPNTPRARWPTMALCKRKSHRHRKKILTSKLVPGRGQPPPPTRIPSI